jgi:cytoskeleton protein RodZ
MSDQRFSEPSALTEENAPNDGLTAGMMLRRAREAAGLHIGALAVAMKIPVKKLEALEADRLDQLHDAVFVRALAASVCRTLKVDPASVLSKLPSNAVTRLKSDEQGINAPFHARGHSGRAPILSLLGKPPAIIVMALLLGVAVVAFFPDVNLTDSTSGSVADSVKPGNREEAPVPAGSASIEVTQPVNATVIPVSIGSAEKRDSGEKTVSADMVAQSPRPIVSSPVQTASQPRPAVADAAEPKVSVAGNAAGFVVFKAKAPSWIKVVDAQGTVHLSKTMVAGEVITAGGTPPLSVIIGRADVVDVEVRGKALSLAPNSKDNVARFEVK